VEGRDVRGGPAPPPRDRLRDQPALPGRGPEAVPGEGSRAARLSLIDETGGRSVRMAHLASVGSHRINGVAALHSELLKADVLRDFHDLWPEKFLNVTNGVTPRRFLALANPRLAALVTEAIGDGWPKDLERLRGLEPLAGDGAFRAKWRASSGPQGRSRRGGAGAGGGRVRPRQASSTSR